MPLNDDQISNIEHDATTGARKVELTGSNTTYPGTTTLSTTAAAIGSNQAVTEVLLQSDASNTTNIKIGNATLQTIVLTPGVSLTIPVNNIADLYAVAVSGTPILNWLGRS